MKRALIFTPYLDSLGGGELYTLTFAASLINLGFVCDLAWKDKQLFPKIQERFSIDMSPFGVSPNLYELFTQNHSLLRVYQQTHLYDVIFFLSDGSVPFLFGKKNILHFQVPFTHLTASLMTKLKLNNQQVVCNSRFTKTVIDQHLQVNSSVLYPPINLKKAGKKEKVILNVGRFTNTLQNKRQDVLIQAFKQMVDEGLKGWKLVLVGNTAQKEANNLVKDLKKEAKGYPIEFHLDVDQETLASWYAKARIYWHAAGYDIDEDQEPEKVEHFGIVTAEAMSAGCVPVVINKGGQKEIVADKHNGFLFDSLEDLKKMTQRVIGNKELEARLATQAQTTAIKFSRDAFSETVRQMI